MIFNIGDSVTVHSKAWLNAMKNKNGIVDMSYYENSLSHEQEAYCGKKVTISYISNDGYYRIVEDNGVNMWYDWMLVLPSILEHKLYYYLNDKFKVCAARIQDTYEEHCRRDAGNYFLSENRAIYLAQHILKYLSD
jgi:hypothetical protein